MWILCSDSFESQQCPLQILWCPRRTVCCLQLFQVRCPKFCFITNCAWTVCSHCTGVKCWTVSAWRSKGQLSAPVCICALVGRAVWSTSQAGGGPAHEVPAGWKEQITKSRVRWRKKCFYIPNMTTKINAGFINIMNFMIILSTLNNIKEMNMKNWNLSDE